jgi:hypothetical protein
MVRHFKNYQGANSKSSGKTEKSIYIAWTRRYNIAKYISKEHYGR